MERIGFGARLWLALVLFLVVPLRVLVNGELAARIRAALRAPSLPPEGPRPGLIEAEPEHVAEAVAEAEPVPETTSALQLLAILQREGRLLDFLMDDVTGYADADVGAAARVVHEGCKRGLADYVELGAVRSESEGAPVVLEAGFDAARIRVTGNVVGDPPFRGTLAHHGWRVTKMRLPKLADGHDPTIVAPAEVELS